MAGSAVLDQLSHVRSISMPSRPQPLAFRVKEELQQHKRCVASVSSGTPQMMCNGLREVNNLYECIEKVLHLPSDQQALSDTHQKKWVEKELDQSVKLLDRCTIMHENLVAMKEHAQDFGLALRRKDAVTETKLQTYSRSAKKVQKEIKNCARSLKQTDSKFRSVSALYKDSNVSNLIWMLVDAREITIPLLQAVSSSLSKPKESKDSRWSLFSRALQQRKVACEDVLECTNEAETLEHLETGLDSLSGD